MNKKIESDFLNPFETHDNVSILREKLNEIDNSSLRRRYKNTEDPITLAFESLAETSLAALTKDFIEESFTDFISFISKICKDK